LKVCSAYVEFFNFSFNANLKEILGPTYASDTKIALDIETLRGNVYSKVFEKAILNKIEPKILDISTGINCASGYVSRSIQNGILDELRKKVLLS
jgi:hypothetical protein